MENRDGDGNFLRISQISAPNLQEWLTIRSDDIYIGVPLLGQNAPNLGK